MPSADAHIAAERARCAMIVRSYLSPRLAIMLQRKPHGVLEQIIDKIMSEECVAMPSAKGALPAEVVQDATIPNAWRVEKLDSVGDGGIDVTIFGGPNAEARAREYVTWKYRTPPAGHTTMPSDSTEQMAALIRGLEEAKAAYARERGDFYLGIMHGMQHAIDIVRRAAHPLNQAGRGDA